MKPFFSIVMPVYNVEKYIEKAIESVQSQTFTEWELIVVNDCTKDDSAVKAQRLAETDERIRLIHHQKNQGLSAARNTGEREASGQYIWFMDPDDYVEEDLLQKVYESLKKNKAKLVVFGLVEEYFDENGQFSYSHEIVPKECLYDTKSELRREIIHLEQATLYGYAWNKIYQLDYLRGLSLHYENVKLIEDILFNVKYCMDIDSMNMLAIPAYHYQKRLDNSLTNKFVPDYYALHKKRIQLLFEQYQYWNMCTDQVKSILGSLYGRYIFSALQRNCDVKSGMSAKDRRQWCREVFKSELFQKLIPYGRAKDGRALQILLFVLRRKNVMACTALGRIIYDIKSKNPMTYSKLRSER
ncbi:MAG: glycosyltransferase family 2 protein [Lachnospiraceae bacterium]|nr:glycosyltransferase family 2 protein [Lachnospiraceae bacterium]